nr:hypothetical protein [Tanacetum cinerariifolium]
QNRNGNFVASRAEGKQKSCKVLQLQRNESSCKELHSIQLQADEVDLMVVVGDIDENEEVNANCILVANL